MSSLNSNFTTFLPCLAPRVSVERIDSDLCTSQIRKVTLHSLLYRDGLQIKAAVSCCLTELHFGVWRDLECRTMIERAAR
jgi:hypothetical protein